MLAGAFGLQRVEGHHEIVHLIEIGHSVVLLEEVAQSQVAAVQRLDGDACVG